VLVLDGLPGPVRGRVTGVTTPAADAVALRLRGGITIEWGGPGGAAAKAREAAALLRTGARYIDVSSPSVAVTGR
jgi:hypothetical protein